MNKELTVDYVVSAIGGYKDCLFMVSPDLFRKAKVIGDYIIQKIIEEQYNGNSEKYPEDIRNCKRAGVRIEMQESFEPNTFNIYYQAE